MCGAYNRFGTCLASSGCPRNAKSRWVRAAMGILQAPTQRGFVQLFAVARTPCLCLLSVYSMDFVDLQQVLSIFSLIHLAPPRVKTFLCCSLLRLTMYRTVSVSCPPTGFLPEPVRLPPVLLGIGIWLVAIRPVIVVAPVLFIRSGFAFCVVTPFD